MEDLSRIMEVAGSQFAIFSRIESMLNSFGM